MERNLLVLSVITLVGLFSISPVFAEQAIVVAPTPTTQPISEDGAATILLAAAIIGVVVAVSMVSLRQNK